MNIQHSSASESWGGPDYILESVRLVLGGIDFDPASSAEFNKVVQATRFMTREDDALLNEWPIDKNSSIYLNPPGGKIKNRSKTALFWQRLMEQQEFKHAIFMGFSLECLQTTQASSCPALAFPICVPRKRLAFTAEDGTPGKAPSHSNVIVYIPGEVDETQKFITEFSRYGYVKP